MASELSEREVKLVPTTRIREIIQSIASSKPVNQELPSEEFAARLGMKVTNFFGASLKDNHPSLWAECAIQIMKRFPQFSYQDVALAIEMAAAKELDGIEVTTWGGRFSVQVILEVMEAYSAYRAVANYMINQESEAQPLVLNESDAAKEEQARKELAQFWNGILEAQKNPEFAPFPTFDVFIGPSPLAITCSGMARLCVEKSIFSFDEKEKPGYWTMAKEQLIEALEGQKKSMRKTDREYAAKLLENTNGGEFLARWKVLYAQLLIWHTHLNPMLWQEI